MAKYILTVECPARRGIVAAVAGMLAQNECNIVDLAQFDDAETQRFFMRTSFESEGAADLPALTERFAAISDDFKMNFKFIDPTQKMKVVIFVSRFGHCLNDLLYKTRIGALPIDIVAVISNHLDHQKLVVNHDIPFHFIKVSKENKQDAEKQQIDIVHHYGAELIILARYMQILSDGMCKTFPGRMINIHHSFLPSFKGANPYRQAHARGVKLIGATAHYVTSDLDEGPIIEQDIVRVTHAQSAKDYVALGRDVESQVLSRAVHAHIQHRVFMNGAKTVLFSPSPDAYVAEQSS